jgi:hypothetical protein
MYVHELLGFATRASARHGHAQRAIRPHAQDVAPCAAYAHELDHGMRLLSGRPRLVRWSIRNPEERQIQLH